MYPKLDVPTEALTDGFSVLFKDCLAVRPDDSILIIVDEHFQPFVGPLVTFLNKERLQATFIAIPKEYQRAMVLSTAAEEYEMPLPRGIVSACRESSIILNCLDSDLATARLRGAILHALRPKECRFAHIPGISEDILIILTTSPIQQILRSAETMAWALGEAKTARLISFDFQGRRSELIMDLDGWDNEPMMSSGVIYPNSWGNALPGEVFCCPDHERVNGTVCINGSIPGTKLDPGDATVVEFERGHLVRWSPESTAVGRFLSEQKALAAERQDENWNAFAELGIGLNPTIAALTGNSLLDEKALGTVHVAIGNNKSFGHKLRSYIHADMVVVNPTLELDEVTVVTSGGLRLDEIEALRIAAQVEPLELKPDTEIHFRRAKLDYQSGAPVRRLLSAGRLGFVPIAELVNDMWLERLIDDASEGEAFSYSELNHSARNDRLDHALAVLYHYRVVKLGKSYENSDPDHTIGSGRSRLQRN